jgi:hypothetical protein
MCFVWVVGADNTFVIISRRVSKVMEGLQQLLFAKVLGLILRCGGLYEPRGDSVVRYRSSNRSVEKTLSGIV